MTFFYFSTPNLKDDRFKDIFLAGSPEALVFEDEEGVLHKVEDIGPTEYKYVENPFFMQD